MILDFRISLSGFKVRFDRAVCMRARVFLGVGIWLSFAFGVVPDGLGQVALQNAVTTDRAIEARRRASETALADQPGGEVGPVRFTLGFSYSIGFSDNVTYSENEAASDFIQAPSVGLGIEVPLTERSSLGFQVEVGYDVYWHNEELSRWWISPDSEIAYDLQVKDALITVFNRISYSQDVYSDPGVAGQATFPRFQNTSGTQVTWIPNDYVLAAGYSYQIVRSGSEDNRQIDRGSHLVLGRVGHLFAQGAINTGAEVSATLTDYVQNTNDTTTIVSLGPYFEWEVSDTLDVRLRGGYVFYSYTTVGTPARSTDDGTFYLGFTAAQQLTDFIDHGLSVTHGVDLGSEQDVAFVIQTGVGYSIAYQFVDPARFVLGVDYVHGEQEQSGGGIAERFDQFRLGAGVRWLLSTRWSLALDYDLYLRDSDLPDRSYTANQVTFTGGYTF